MIHNIKINNPNCILANIYVREKDSDTNIINLDHLLTNEINDMVDYYHI